MGAYREKAGKMWRERQAAMAELPHDTFHPQQLGDRPTISMETAARFQIEWEKKVCKEGAGK